MISKKEYKRNCEYAKTLKELEEKCDHPMDKRLWYHYKGELFIACECCGFSKVVGDYNG